MRKFEWNLEEIKKLVKDATTFSEVLRGLNIPIQGNNGNTLKRILNENNIDYSHFAGRAKHYKTHPTKIEDYLNNKIKIKTFKLKQKLLKENLIENKCSVCGLTSWLNKPIVLQLHHIDGNSSNNNLNNLQLLCPNCHSQTDNYCGNANKDKTKYYCPECGREINKGSARCSLCASHKRRKMPNITSTQLLNDFRELKSFIQVGKKYNVSDNSIKKWCKRVGLPTAIKELKKLL
jgi:Zn finger protein HypA/HybF involved in hydrogenase expression